MIQIIVHAKQYGGTHVARCGTGEDAVRGSSTTENKEAAFCAARKWFRARRVVGHITLQAQPVPAKGWEISYVATIDPS